MDPRGVGALLLQTIEFSSFFIFGPYEDKLLTVATLQFAKITGRRHYKNCD